MPIARLFSTVLQLLFCCWFFFTSGRSPAGTVISLRHSLLRRRGVEEALARQRTKVVVQRRETEGLERMRIGEGPVATERAYAVSDRDAKGFLSMHYNYGTFTLFLYSAQGTAAVHSQSSQSERVHTNVVFKRPYLLSQSPHASLHCCANAGDAQLMARCSQ